MALDDVCLPRVAAVMILDADGGRIATKAFTAGLLSGQGEAVKTLQSSVFHRSKLSSARDEADIFLLDDYTVVFRGMGDASFYVVGDTAENELILSSVLNALVETLSGLLRHLDRRTLLDNLALVLLTLDEVVDSGMILETNPLALRRRVMMRSTDDPGAGTPMAELTISEALKQAREQMLKSMGRA